MTNEVKVQTKPGSVQDTGNPVFDATVNILMNSNSLMVQPKWVRPLYQALAEIYDTEQKADRTPRSRR